MSVIMFSERHSNYPHKEVHDQPTTSAETNGKEGYVKGWLLFSFEDVFHYNKH